MSEIINLNTTTPVAPTTPGPNQNVTWQKGPSSGIEPSTGLPVYPVTAAPQPATPTLLGVVMPDGITITVDDTGTISANASYDALQQQVWVFAVDTGAANAYVVAQTPAPTLQPGSIVIFQAFNANTGASTLAVNGATPAPITKNGTVNLSGGEIAANQIVEVVYDGVEFQLIGGIEGVSSGGGTSSGQPPVVPSGAINGSNTVFTLPTAGAGNLFVNGVMQNAFGSTPDYTLTNGTTITLANAPVAGTQPDWLVWVYIAGVQGPQGPAGPAGTSGSGTGTTSGGGAATVRGSGIQASSATSYTVAWPSGTVAGDLALIFYGHGYQIGAIPTGWILLDEQNGANWNGALIFRVLDASDISAGSVTVSASQGPYDGCLAILTLVGIPNTQTLVSRQVPSGNPSEILTFFPDKSNLMVGYCSNRAASTDTCSVGTQLQSANDGANASGCLFAGSAPSGTFGVNVTFSYSVQGSGSYQIAIALSAPA